MHSLHEGELSIEASVSNRRLRLDWSGRSVHRDPGTFLRPYLTEAFGYVEQNGLSLEMHFERLAQFNSSTIAVVVQFVAIARSRSLPLHLFYDSRARWQTMSFDALKRALQPFGETRASSVVVMAAPTPSSGQVPRAG